MKLKINKIELFLLSLGILWIFYFIYNYIIRHRVSYTLKAIDNIFILLFLTLLLFIQLLPLLSSLNVKMICNLIILLDKIYNNVYWKPLNAVFNTIIKNIPGVGDLLIFLSKNIVKLYNKISPNFGIKCCLIIDTIPRIILMLVFIIDVFIYNHIYYLILFAPLLIPYITLLRLFIYILRDFNDHNRKDHETFLNITQLNDRQYKVEFKPHKAYLQDKINLYCNRYFLFKNTHIITDMIINTRDNIIKPYFSKITYSVYLLGAIKIFLVSCGIINNDFSYY